MDRRISTPIILSLVVVAFAGLGAAGPTIAERVATETLIKVVAVVGLWVFVGNSGVISFGHAGFAAIGAYVSAWLTLPVTLKKVFLAKLPDFILATELGIVPAAAIGMAAAALVAAIVGIAIVRLSGIAASIATLAWLAIVYTVFANAEALTRGTGSLVGLPLVTSVWLAAGAAVLAIVVAFAFKQSRTGLVLRASREDEAAAAAAGIDVRRARLVGFALSAALVALAGVLQGHFLGILAVGNFYLEWTFLTLAMLVVGGRRTLSGAVAGALVLSLAAEALRSVESGITIAGATLQAGPGTREVALALVMLAILLWRPRGLFGDREIGFGGSPSRVIPAKAGTHVGAGANGGMGPGFRRDDAGGEGMARGEGMVQ